MDTSPLFDRFYGMDGINPYGSPYNMDTLLSPELTRSELQSLLEHYLEAEDYISAAGVRDKLREHDNKL